MRSLLAGDDVFAARKELQSFVSESGFLRCMVDFADHLLATPTHSGKARTVTAVRSLVSRLADYLGLHIKGQNPGELSTAELEEIYVRLLQETGAANTGGAAEHRARFKLANCLRTFHEYLGVRYNKEPVEDRAILFCGETFSDVDAEFLSVEEFDKLRCDIDLLLLNGTLTPFERRVARILVSLSYRCGFRRQEALNCTIQEMQLDCNGHLSEIIFTSSEGRTFKSDSALRRIRAEIIPRTEREELEEFIHERLRQTPKPTDFLFGDAEEEIRAASPRIIDSINSIMPGDSHFHSLRHSAGTSIMVRLLASEQPISNDFFLHLDETSKSFKDGETLRRILHRHNRNTRKHAYKLAQFLGHLSPITSFTYVHMFDFMARGYFDQSPSMRVDPKLVRKASGVSRSTWEGWEKTGGELAIPLNLFRRLGGAPEKRKSSPPTVGRVPSTSERIEEVYGLLYSVGTWKRDIAEVAAIRRIPLAVATHWVGLAKYLEQMKSQLWREGGWRHHMEEWTPDPRHAKKKMRVACPTYPIQSHDKEIVARFAPAINALANSDSPWERELLSKALVTYVNRVWYSRPSVIFHDLESTEEALNYVRFLRKLGIYMQDIGWYSFDESVRGEFCVQWNKALNLHEYRIQILVPRNPTEESRAWFAIMPPFSFVDAESGGPRYTNIENPGAFGFRYLMLMSFILFGRH